MARRHAASTMTGAAGLPGLAVLATGLLLFAVALVAVRWQRRSDRDPRRDAGRDLPSMIGIAVQALAFVAVTGSGTSVKLDPLGAPALIAAAVTAILTGGALALFVWSTVALGDDWSLVARMRQDHRLVTHGPFAWVRHPIYTALGTVVIAIAVALGHPARLGIALPVYALGTWLRIRSEERLLHTTFGAHYVAYATRVKRFIPGFL
ncbi:isoprenylcysteine carboxylmethyltransferase family protein [Sphingomonadaceae bacterium OTU29MARTA1]|nr:isoprenylcysteine carboxylmethyltransferase family protein [Sphingomonadaceae bacterium OTU29MARTA1]